MRRFVSKDSKRDFYILYTLVFGVIAGFIYSVCGVWKVFGVES